MIETVDNIECADWIRIIHKFKPGLCDYYTVEGRFLFGLMWLTINGEAYQNMTSEVQALDWIKAKYGYVGPVRIIEKRYGKEEG